MIRLLAFALLALGVFLTPAIAQTPPPKVFVASTGSDTNDGGRATPKRSFQAAHDSVAAGGEIVVLDTAGYGPVTITKSVSVVVPPGVNGFVTGTGGIGIAVTAGVNDIVTLRGLIVEGTGTNYGIQSSTVGTLVVEDTTVRNFSHGISILATTPSRLIVRRGAIRDTATGIQVGTFPYSGGNAVAHVTDTELTSNGTAISSIGNNSSYAAYVFAGRIAVSGTTGSVFRADGKATIIADSSTVVDSATVFESSGGATTFARNNSVVRYTSYGSPGTFAGTVQ